MSSTFNVANLSPFFGPEESESRTTPSQEGEDDEDIPIGPITRARAKKINQQVNSLLIKFGFNLHENWLLPNSIILIVLRFVRKIINKESGAEKGSMQHQKF